MTRAQIFRLIWIDAFIAAGKFPLQREHLCVTFDISVPQASNDLRDFQKSFPGRITYDKSRKGYVATDGSAAAFDDAAHSAIFIACAAAARAADRLRAAHDAMPEAGR